MGKKSAGEDKYESQKDSTVIGNGSPNEALGVKPNVDVGDDRKHKKKRKLQLDSTENLKEDEKKDKRAKYDGETSGSGDKERKKDNMSNKRDNRTKDDAEASEIGNEEEKKKDKKKKKDKYDAMAIEVEEVSKDADMVAVEKARKDNKILDDIEVSDMDCEEKKKKDRKSKKGKNNVQVLQVLKVSNDSHTVTVEKSRKDSRTIDDAEVSEGSCEEKKRKKDGRNKKHQYDVEPSGVQDDSNDTEPKKVEKVWKKGKRTESDTEASKGEENSKMEIIDLQNSHTEKEKKRKKKKKSSGDLDVGLEGIGADKPVNASCGIEDNNFVEAGSPKNPGRKREVNDDNVRDGIQDKKKRAKSVKKGASEKIQEVPRTDLSKNPIEKETPKRVSFSDQVEVFPSSDGPSDVEAGNEDSPSDVDKAGKGVLVRGKRFTPEEDEMIKKAVFDYIEQHDLGEEGVDLILHCKGNKELRNCWKDIAAVLPWRPYESVYYRGHMLFERDENRKWSTDDYELVRKFHEKHGSNWRTLADALGKHRLHVKDTWRRIKLPDMKTGNWSQDEYQNLFDLVNMDLRLKAFQEKKSKHGMLRDNICWEAISDKLSTRTNATCCRKWYSQLTSPMVSEGQWADTDDYHLVDALQNLDACCIGDVDWDNLLEHRPGDVCRKRWNQMVNHLGHLGTKSFAEQVEVLAKRYCLDVLEAREAYDSQPAGDS